jgi:L-rhamnose mutarotase
MVGFTKSGLRRVGFFMRFEPINLPTYLRLHERVWPEMQTALVACGWHNYNLFCGENGLAFGFFETDHDFATACARMDAWPVNARWQESMKEFTPLNLSPIEAAGQLTHFFYSGADHAVEREAPPLPPFDQTWSVQSFTGATRLGLTRTCFSLSLNASALQRLMDAHRTMPAEIRSDLHSNGISALSLYARDDGMLVGFCESHGSEFAAALNASDSTPHTTKWHKLLREHAVGERTADVGTSPRVVVSMLRHYFYLGSCGT